MTGLDNRRPGKQALVNITVAGLAQDEVDLEQLAAALLQIGEETMRPANSSLWLKANGSQQVAPQERQRSLPQASETAR